MLPGRSAWNRSKFHNERVNRCLVRLCHFLTNTTLHVECVIWHTNTPSQKCSHERSGKTVASCVITRRVLEAFATKRIVWSVWNHFLGCVNSHLQQLKAHVHERCCEHSVAGSPNLAKGQWTCDTTELPKSALQARCNEIIDQTPWYFHRGSNLETQVSLVVPNWNYQGFDVRLLHPPPLLQSSKTQLHEARGDLRSDRNT